MDEYGRPIPIDEGTLNRQRTPAPGPIGWISSELEHDLHWLIRRIEGAADWEMVDHYAGQILGQQVFGLGVGYGIAGNLVGSAHNLLVLNKVFVLANLYDVAHHRSVGMGKAREPIWKRSRQTACSLMSWRKTAASGTRFWPNRSMRSCIRASFSVPSGSSM